MNKFVCNDDVDDWMHEHTNAGYASNIILTEDDVEKLKAGYVLVVGGEYGIAIEWETEAEPTP